MAERTLSPTALLAGVLGLIAAVHLPLLRFGFIYDDGWTLRSNGFLRPGHFDLALLFSPEAAARHVPDAFRPTLVMFDAASLRVLGLETWAHHGLSIVLHLGVCVLLARLLGRLGAPDQLALASVACFGLLAIHAEAIAVISFREDLLAAGLGLAALLCALRSIDAASTKHAIGWGLIAALLEALACGAKLSAAPLPGLLLLLAWLRPWQLRLPASRLALATAMLGLGVMLALAQTWIVHGGSPYGGDNPRVFAERVGLGPVLAASMQIHVGYLQQMLAPLDLSPEYVDFGARWSSPKTMLASATLLGLAIAAVLPSVRRRWPLASLAVLGWLLLCVPTSNLIGLPNMRADRFMYLPSLTICIGVAAGLLKLGRRLPADREHDESLVWAPLIAFVLIQGSLGMAAARVYVSNTTLWATAVERAPDSARAHALLGLARVGEIRQGEHLAEQVAEAAERSCLRAQQLDPLYELPQVCLGALAIAREQWVVAYEHHARAIELSVDRNDRLIAALAQLALDLPSEWIAAHPEIGERRDHAIALLDRGLRAYPYSPELHAAAARVHHRLGQPTRAFELYRRARSLRPDRWETIAGGVELALDLGDAAAAHRTWWAEAEVLTRADPATRTRLIRRLAAARTHPDFSFLNSLLNPGVFPDEP
ncbi:MAG TPA: bacterial transcriptional activator domain-containing protein [Enhygromyxa sp.]|nr:bacterial transcriptional activator domain-containing protein [Enhygromyxa sp.]